LLEGLDDATAGGVPEIDEFCSVGGSEPASIGAKLHEKYPALMADKIANLILTGLSPSVAATGAAPSELGGASFGEGCSCAATFADDRALAFPQVLQKEASSGLGAPQ